MLKAGETVATEQAEVLALFGGPKAVQSDPGDLFDWPIVTEEDEQAIMDVLKKRAMSGTDITLKFEEDFAAWQGTQYTLGFSSGTAALQAAMYGCGIGVGDELICPSLTYWASCLQVYSIGGTVVFAEVDPETLCLDPNDLENRISERTKAIMCVHYLGHPCDMDAINEVARKHNLKVIEDVSHAQGALYKGRKVGTLGDVSAMSLMSGKSLAVGEAGILATDNLEIYERAMSLGHYERFDDRVQTPALREALGLPAGGYKYRMHQMSSAMGRVQLKHYDERCAEIQKSMNYFWDCLEGVPGVKAHRPAKDSGSTMGGWYAAHGLYRPEELGGLSCTRFCQAVTAEGVGTSPGANMPLHRHPVFNTYDVYGHGKPTRIANSDRDLRQPAGSLPVTELMPSRCYSIPWFKKFRPEIIEEYANAFRKAAENYERLLEDDPGDGENLGGWHFFRHSN